MNPSAVRVKPAAWRRCPVLLVLLVSTVAMLILAVWRSQPVDLATLQQQSHAGLYVVDAAWAGPANVSARAVLKSNAIYVRAYSSPPAARPGDCVLFTRSREAQVSLDSLLCGPTFPDHHDRLVALSRDTEFQVFQVQADGMLRRISTQKAPFIWVIPPQ